MAKNFSELFNKLSPEAQKEVKEGTKKILSEMPLRELRLANDFSQEKLAEKLSTKQANVSRLEQRTDMYVSTLKSFIEAMGGEMDIIARFPKGDIKVGSFKKTRGNQETL